MVLKAATQTRIFNQLCAWKKGQVGPEEQGVGGGRRDPDKTFFQEREKEAKRSLCWDMRLTSTLLKNGPKVGGIWKHSVGLC